MKAGINITKDEIQPYYLPEKLQIGVVSGENGKDYFKVYDMPLYKNKHNYFINIEIPPIYKHLKFSINIYSMHFIPLTIENYIPNSKINVHLVKDLLMCENLTEKEIQELIINKRKEKLENLNGRLNKIF